MSEYTPTTEEVRHRYCDDTEVEYYQDDEAEFDRWLEQVQAEAWKEGYVSGFLKAMGGELDGSAREAVLPGLSTKGIGMIKCTHCGCELTSRLTVWVHVHSGSHQCDGGMDIGVPVMDARGRIVYQDAHGERAAEYRKEVGE